jgi:tripartite-type tricarboxylate transporter receptor subunit TctC
VRNAAHRHPATPQPLIEQLNRDIAAALNVPESKQRLNDLGLDLVVSLPPELAAHAQKESKIFGQLVTKAGIVKE